MNSKPKILIIEDNKHNHDLYRTVFEAIGFEVVLHENADGFFPEEVSSIKPDIISMDLMMGKDGAATERDGFEAIEKLKGDLRTNEIPIIVLTSFFEESKVRRAKELGAIDYINVAGQSIKKIPEQYMRYIQDPKNFTPSHPIFRE